MSMDLNDDEEVFLHGYCHLLAVYLHRLTGKPLFATLDYDDDINKTVLVHAYIKDDNNFGIDIRGRFDLATIRDDFDIQNDPWETEISTEDLMMLGHGCKEPDENLLIFQLAKSYAEKVSLELGLTQQIRLKL